MQGSYEFRPFSEEVTALRLGARRRSTGLYAYELQRCEPPCLWRGVAYIECARTPASPHNGGFNVHKGLALLVTPYIKCYHGHKDYLIIDRLDTEWFLISWRSSESSWSSVFESVEWNITWSIGRWFLLEMSLGRVSWTCP